MTDAEREDFQNLFSRRLERVKEMMRSVFHFQETERPPFLVNSASYVLFGTPKDEIPPDYYDHPSIMTSFQEKCSYDQIKSVDDDFVPYLVPWFGTGVLSSAFGTHIYFPEKEDPVADSRNYVINGAEDINKLQMINPERDGLMPKVLDFITYMKKNSFLPVGITDCQGPLTTACQIMGYDKLFYAMHDNPALVHVLMDKISESLISWVRKQKEAIDENSDECFGDQLIYTGENIGVWMSDDDAVIVSPQLYREFVVPYNSRVLQAFGGGVVHYCGTANHQIDNFLSTEGLRALNVYCLHNIQSVIHLKKRIENRIVLLLCDYTPLDYVSYYDELLKNISHRGLILHTQFSPIVMLTKDGRYRMADRKKDEKSRICNYLKTYFHKKSFLRQ